MRDLKAMSHWQGAVACGIGTALQRPVVDTELVECGLFCLLMRKDKLITGWQENMTASGRIVSTTCPQHLLRMRSDGDHHGLQLAYNVTTTNGGYAKAISNFRLSDLSLQEISISLPLLYFVTPLAFNASDGRVPLGRSLS